MSRTPAQKTPAQVRGDDAGSECWSIRIPRNYLVYWKWGAGSIGAVRGAIARRCARVEKRFNAPLRGAIGVSSVSQGGVRSGGLALGNFRPIPPGSESVGGFRSVPLGRESTLAAGQTDVSTTGTLVCVWCDCSGGIPESVPIACSFQCGRMLSRLPRVTAPPKRDRQ